jgi:lipopolysaccharide export system permease protein
MQIMDRYIGREFIMALFYCLAAFIFLYIIVDLFNYIDEMMRNNLPVSTIVIYYATFVPNIFVQVAPIAALLATIYTLSNLKRYNELTALRVSGVSLWKVIKPLIFMTALLSITVFVVNDRVVPKFTPISSEIRDEKIEVIGSKKKDPVINDIAVFGEHNRIIYAQSFDTEKNELEDIIIHQNDRNQNLALKLSAERGYWEDGKWVFENGTMYRLNPAGYMIGTPMTFRRKIMDLSEKPKHLARKGRLPEFMTFKQLRTYIDRFSSRSSTTTRKLLVDLHYKLSFPLVSLIVILVASPVAFMMQRGGLLIGIATSIIIGVSFFVVQGASLAMGKAGVLPPLLSAWLANILFLAAGIYLMKRCR